MLGELFFAISKPQFRRRARQQSTDIVAWRSSTDVPVRGHRKRKGSFACFEMDRSHSAHQPALEKRALPR